MKSRKALRAEREDARFDAALDRLLNAQRARFEAQLRINEMLFELATGKRLHAAQDVVTGADSLRAALEQRDAEATL